jgi:hypothetical protein
MSHINIKPYDSANFPTCNYIELDYLDANYSVDYQNRVIVKSSIIIIQEDRDETRVSIFMQNNERIDIDFNSENTIQGYPAATTNNEFYNDLLDAIFGTKYTP